jgi:hypothetical protein
MVTFLPQIKKISIDATSVSKLVKSVIRQGLALFANQDTHCLQIKQIALYHVIQIVPLANQIFLIDAYHAILMPLFVSLLKNVS